MKESRKNEWTMEVGGNFKESQSTFREKLRNRWTQKLLGIRNKFALSGAVTLENAKEKRCAHDR